jgi:N-acetylated-alpha-linked acidic dipeptidase
MTAKPHLAGTSGERQLAEYIESTWKLQGLDPVQMVSYDILLSYPDKNDPSRITLYDENNQTVYVTQLVEKILRPEQNQSDVVPPFNVFSPPGHMRV